VDASPLAAAALGGVASLLRILHDRNGMVPFAPEEAFHAALGVDPTDYDYEVFRVTNEIARQVYPVELDINAPAFRSGLERIRQNTDKMEAIQGKDPISWLRKKALVLSNGLAFLQLYLLPVRKNKLPAKVRLQPAW